jgi:hypothetical protein
MGLNVNSEVTAGEIALRRADPEEMQKVIDNARKKHEIQERKHTGRQVDRARLFGFETMAKMDDATIKRMIARVNLADLIMGLTGADDRTKQAVLRNMPQKMSEISSIIILKMEKGGLPDNIIMRCRDIISDAYVILLRD